MNHTLGTHKQNGARPLRSHNPYTDVDELELMQACDIFHALFLSYDSLFFIWGVPPGA